MNVKTQFSIKDLENLSHVKAHTIRIWEKRYNLLQPNRTDTNIRQYDLENLKKLLNVTFLYNEGLKISKIAKLNEVEIRDMVKEKAEVSKDDYALSMLKSAMLDFDTDLFFKTFKTLMKTRTFREVFFEIFMPLLEDIGTLWQTGTIDPSHERFISELIKQQVVVNTNIAMQKKPTHNDPVFVLYLPYEEIHEIGLLYVNYELISLGFKTIFLGSNIPLNSLKHVIKHHRNVQFISYFTVKPEGDSLVHYMEEFNSKIKDKKKFPLWLMGYKTQSLTGQKIPSNCTVIPNLQALIEKVETLKKS